MPRAMVLTLHRDIVLPSVARIARGIMFWIILLDVTSERGRGEMRKENESRDIHGLPVDPSSTGIDTYSVSKEK